MTTLWLIGFMFAVGLTEKDDTGWRRFLWLAAAWPYVVGKWWRDDADSWIEEDGWIDVNDRLPDSDGEFVVFDTMNNKVHHDYFVVPADGSSPFWNHYGPHVTHWMPLAPKPSK